MVLMNVSRLVMSRADEVFPALEKIPAMQRRRLSPIAKLALNTAIQALSEQQADYIVWVSQYGDEHKTLKILEDVLNDQTPSPTQFSTSVHNAVSGLYSILCQDSTPATSLAGSWNDGLTEAYAWLKTAQFSGRVLVVYYDEPLPDIYAEHQPFVAFAMAAMVTLKPENLCLKLEHMTQDAFSFQQALQFYHFWQDERQTESAAWTKC
ncbi:beta-ketoacyl synthase [Acinetobacter sp. ANC 5054]|uniref:beta-ketoacyl synthase chain length factor n=1 Tax=Acinetobacter sp. ANC 5054 TaxID=1977877 RepID=UPI000A35B936|nr:beta-ketoacyl synthase chain length factor [Acinetobacter sp. ANC 5054]OTG80919.1 beta-ketoacyl synthase [Acinetobacter sp. ANC 5054]